MPEPHFLDELDAQAPLTLGAAHGAMKKLEEQVISGSRDPRVKRPGIVGQEALIRRLICAFLLGEHCLLEGSPGLVKTHAAKVLASTLGLRFNRIQFTPDLMPNDLIGRDRLHVDARGKSSIVWEHGPIFTNILLADEFNRASSKVQSALLEATEERQASILNRQRASIRPAARMDRVGYLLPDEAALLDKSQAYFGVTRVTDPAKDLERPQQFMVVATMNPIEQEGVFPLSEAQLDRFAYKLAVDHPRHEDLRRISAHAFEHPPLDVDGDYDPELHVKTLYFLTALRRLILGERAMDLWMADDNPVRARCELLVSLTHVGRPTHADDDFDRASTTPRFKDEEMVAKLMVWSDQATAALRPLAQRLLAWQKHPTYPDIRGGASPRAMLKLVRAAHAQAFFDRGVATPEWKDVSEVAPDILRHRIRVAGMYETTGTVAAQFAAQLAEEIGS